MQMHSAKPLTPFVRSVAEHLIRKRKYTDPAILRLLKALGIDSSIKQVRNIRGRLGILAVSSKGPVFKASPAVKKMVEKLIWGGKLDCKEIVACMEGKGKTVNYNFVYGLMRSINRSATKPSKTDIAGWATFFKIRLDKTKRAKAWEELNKSMKLYKRLAANAKDPGKKKKHLKEFYKVQGMLQALESVMLERGEPTFNRKK